MDIRYANGGSDETKSSVLKGITQNIWTLWPKAIMRCYHGRQCGSPFMESKQGVNQVWVGDNGQGQQVCREVSGVENNFPLILFNFSGQITVNILTEKSTLNAL